ncbi:MAG: serine/threonine protein kinase [Psychromonas sp.]|nr:serine/threonine protein kinase [Alteromonadales bacterium]MCP5076450.1 serine/threonine protein kinase [Psychromonas sp.]
MSDISEKVSSELDPKTVFQPQIIPERCDEKTVVIVKSQHEELTRIGKSIRSQDSSTGFEVAKEAANNALQAQKIVLNNRFVLESTLGAGGMGTVYKARDLRKVEASDISTDVAVKVLNEDFKNHPNAFISLQREASRSHLLSHPNIVTVHDFDRDDDVIFMTMELLKGQGLDALLRDHQGTGLKLKDAHPIINDYCAALAYAHKKHIIHSDFKPGNVFVSEDGTKVLDFGIARISNSSSSEDHFDAGDLGALTPAYASLEMINGEDPHPSDDVYAAALIAYELLSGRHPYERLAADEVKAKKLKPARIEQLSKRQWKAISSALVVERKDRTQSIDEFWHVFANKKRKPIFLLTCALFLPVIGWFSYINFIAQSEVSKLAESTFSKAQVCLQSKQYACAVDSAKAVLKISPQYTGALALLDQAKSQQKIAKLDNLLNDVKTCINNHSDSVCAGEVVYSMEKLSAVAIQTSKAKALLNDFKLAVTIDLNINEASLCLENKKYTCAINSADKVLVLEAGQQEAVAIKLAAQGALASIEDAKRIQKETYDGHLSSATLCITKAQYKCAKKWAIKAISVKPSEEARLILRQADFALLEQKRNRIERQKTLAKAEKTVQQAQSCLNKKKYDCAIAKSESALDLVPNYKPALIIQSSATKERQNLKSNFSLQ